jgi:D-sedoheptulose 7-phosphate isomerase
VFVEWLKTSRVNEKDCILVLSVGGGHKAKNVSANLVHALIYAKEQKAKIIGVVGRDGGYTARVANACCVIPTIITPHTEAFQAVVLRALVPHPKLKES